VAGIPQSQDDLRAHLDDHLGFLVRSSEAFDQGHDGEVKRLAVSLRVLFHDTGQSHSLLGQLGRLGGEFISTAIPHDSGNIATHGGLIMTSLGKGASTHFAPLDDVPITRWLPFQDWWNEIVFVDAQRAQLTRRDLVLAVANQDGGAHVDPKLSETYARLSRHNSMGWVQNPGNVPIPNAERAAVRQIAHEALKTLVPNYQKKPTVNAEIIFGGAMVHEGASAPPMQRSPKVGRNDPCPCGSGKKYKKCHGAI
jgi:hypothetical protein